MNDDAGTPLSLELIRAAHSRIAPHVLRTPVMTSESLDALAGASLYFKCENFQKVGAFKARGATNAVFSLGEAEAARGVATHSSGNHAAALSRAARLRGIPAHIVMPHTAPRAKQESVRRYGGRIVHCEPTLAAREAAAARVVAETGATLVHPYDDLRVMAGQGTTALELHEQVADLDLVICPVGGGGLMSGVAVATKALRPRAQMLVAEPEKADDAARSYRSGQLMPPLPPSSIADGLLTALSARTFAEMRRHVDDVLTVSEAGIVAAMRRIWEVLKIVVEPSGAVPYAAVMEHGPRFAGRRVGLILTGGNLDLDRLPWMTGPTS